ncbi:hypothetical protein ACLE20_07005 [Rhizobium sp. YIM 134829]|uniref:hypothetical protein n=1 Tax=Rhizobium sp. YIM 134829 TaxID=3390453 RepID=UPI003978E318
MLLLLKLAQMQAQAPGRPFAVDQTELGQRFGVSRTHVGRLLKTASADGGLSCHAGGLLHIHPNLLAALDQNIAHRLSLLDRAHALAVAHLTIRDGQSSALVSADRLCG